MEYVNIDVSIEAAIPKYKKGDRVIVNLNTAEDPEYYVASVTGIRSWLVYVRFDDNDKDKFKPNKSKIGLIGITKSKRVRKSQIPTKDISNWISIDTKKNNIIPKGLLNWVKDYKQARKTGNVDLAKKLKINIDKKIKLLKLNPRMFMV